MRIIVAGGCGVLGRAVVAKLHEQGHEVAVVDVASSTDGYAGPGAYGVDLADEAAINRAYGSLRAELGGLDGLVHAAGGFVWETLTEGSIDTWDKMYRLNVRTAVVSSRAAIPFLPDGGAIVNVGAAAATNVAIGMAAYAASKLGIIALTEGLAAELRDRHIRVNAILPTILDTPSNREDMPEADAAQWVQPDAAADVVSFLLSRQAACITGATIRLSLGNTP